MSYSSILVKHGSSDAVSCLRMNPNTLVTGDLSDPIEIPTKQGQYYLNISDRSRTFEKVHKQDPIVFNQTFELNSSSYPSYVVSSTSSFKYDHIPNGKYLLLMDTNVINPSRRIYGDPTIGFRVDDEYFSVTHLNNYSTSISAHTIVNVSNNRLEIGVKAVHCNRFSYNGFKVTLIPL